MFFQFVHLLIATASVHGLVSNIKEVNQLASAGSAKTPSDSLFSGDYVCDKYASTIQSSNDTTDFPVNLNMYVAVTEDAPNDNYTVDFYFKNPNHQSLNDFAILNASDLDSVLLHYNPVLISEQPGFGVEFKFNFEKGLLCQFLYQFTIAYQLERQDDHSQTSDKIFLVGSCQENKQFHPDAYNSLIDEGFRCVEYNSGFKYDGGLDWCSEFYPADQCCNTYENDEVTSRDQCPAAASASVSTSLGAPVSTVASSTLVTSHRPTIALN